MSQPSPPIRLLFPLLILAFTLASCTIPASRYLATGPITPAAYSDPATAMVLIHPFTETFSSTPPIGRHLFSGNKQTKLLIKPQSASHTLTNLLQQELTTRKITVARNDHDWDQSPASLASFKSPNRLLITGQISHLALNVDETFFSTKARVEIDVECVLGQIRDKKVIRRHVHVTQEMIRVRFNQQELEKLLHNCLTAASKEILAQCSNIVAFIPIQTPPQSPTTETNEPRVSASHERISKTYRGRDSYPVRAKNTGTFSLQSPLT